MRLSDLQRVLSKRGFTIEPGAKHFKVTAPDGKAYMLPCHNGARTELTKIYLRGLCRAFGLTEEDLNE
jgi:hypothetical protein